MQCTTLVVPLDWSEPDGARIELALARLPAHGDRIGSLLTNPGGPGRVRDRVPRLVAGSQELAEPVRPRVVGSREVSVTSTAVACERQRRGLPRARIRVPTTPSNRQPSRVRRRRCPRSAPTTPATCSTTSTPPRSQGTWRPSDWLWAASRSTTSGFSYGTQIGQAVRGACSAIGHPRHGSRWCGRPRTWLSRSSCSGRSTPSTQPSTRTPSARAPTRAPGQLRCGGSGRRLRRGRREGRGGRTCGWPRRRGSGRGCGRRAPTRPT